MSVGLIDGAMDLLADHCIIDQGTSGDWYYRKWSDGILECWLHKNIGTVNAKGSFGGTYYGDTSLTLPVTFARDPAAFASGYWDSGMAWMNARDFTDNLTKIRIQFYKNSPGNAEALLHLYLIGEWK